MLIRQTDHADLASQFAAHWGNERFDAPDPAGAMIFAAAHHDDHYRDIEAPLQIVPQLGRPYGHRELPESAAHFPALRKNLAWLEERDPFAALMVSMHHSGLPQNRYGAAKLTRVGSGGGGVRRKMTPELSSLIEQLESEQRKTIERRELDGDRVKLCYQLLQVFDLLSLYFCCDGLVDEKLCATQLEQTPLGPESASISIAPLSDRTISISPYPFNVNPLKIVVMARAMRALPGASDEECRLEFERAPRVALAWTLNA